MVWKECAKPASGWSSCGEGAGRDRRGSVLLERVIPSDTAMLVSVPFGKLTF